MVTGLSLSTTIPYSPHEPNQCGYKVNKAILKEEMTYFYYEGMHIAFLVSFVLCFIALIITGYRLFTKKNYLK